jgi:hypothetical protein
VGIYERVKWLEDALQEIGAHPNDKIRVTRTIVVEGTQQWVIDNISRAFMPRLGDYRTMPNGKVSCIDQKIDVVD